LVISPTAVHPVVASAPVELIGTCLVMPLAAAISMVLMAAMPAVAVSKSSTHWLSPEVGRRLRSGYEAIANRRSKTENVTSIWKKQGNRN
jgi:hypothetical protein